MPTGRKVWLGILLAAGAYETYGILAPDREDTLSEFTRWAFHTNTPIGGALFLTAFAAFAVWYPIHILRRKK